MSAPQRAIRTLERDCARERPAPASLANGWLGLRVPLVPLLGGTCTVSGFMGPDPDELVRGFAAAPYPLACDIRCDGWWLSQRPDLATAVAQRLDLSAATLRTTLRVRCGAALLDVVIEQFASRALPAVAVQRLQITADRDVEVVLRPHLQLVAGGAVTAHVGSAIAWKATDGDTLGLALHVLGGDARGAERVLRLERGRAGVCDQLAALVPDRVHPAPHLQAARLAWLAAQRGYEGLLADHRQAWAEVWRGRTVIDGPDEDQEALDAAFFHLHSAVQSSTPASTGLFGLSRWPDYHYFRGHVFWDLDTFAVPVLALTDPGAARALIDWRVGGLPAARRHAAMHGWQGAQFPWEAGPDGEEVTPIGWPHIQWEQHVSPDIAVSVARLAQATGGDLRQRAWPILEGVAEWIASRVSRDADGAHLRRLTGIDESRVPCDDNCWTNAGARETLRHAVHAARTLGEPIPAAWRDLAETIVLPLEEDGRALAIHGGWRDGGTRCPDAAMAVFPLGIDLSADLRDETLRRQLALAEEFLGMPMHPVFHAAWAALIGDRQLAARRWRAGFLDYVFDDLHLIDEFGAGRTTAKPRVGPYLAHCAGTLRTVIEGFCGLVPGWDEPKEWVRRPVCLPAGWEAVRIERLWMRGEPVAVEAVQGAPARLHSAAAMQRAGAARST